MFFVSCVSLQEKIDIAEKSVNDAEKINASKYAPEDIKSASDFLQQAKVHKATGLKDKSEDAVVKAKTLANKAYFKSVDEFVKSQNTMTSERMDSAKKSKADELAPEKYSEAKKLADQVQNDLKKLEDLQKKLKDLETKNN